MQSPATKAFSEANLLYFKDDNRFGIVRVWYWKKKPITLDIIINWLQPVFVLFYKL